MTITVENNMIRVTVKTTYGAVKHAVRVLPKEVVQQLHYNAPYVPEFTLTEIPLQCGYQSRIEYLLSSMSDTLSYTIAKTTWYMLICCLLATVSASIIIVTSNAIIATVITVVILTLYITLNAILYHKRITNWKVAIEGLRHYFIKEYSRFNSQELERKNNLIENQKARIEHTLQRADTTRNYLNKIETRLNEAVKLNKDMQDRLLALTSTTDKLLTVRAEQFEHIEKSRDGILVLYQDLLNHVPTGLVDEHVDRCRELGIEFSIVEEDAEFHGVGTMTLQ